MTKTIENLFQFLHLFSNVVVLLVFVFFIKKAKKEKGLIAIAVYCVFDLLLNYFYLNLPKKSSLYIGALFTFIEYFIFTFFIWNSIRSQKFKKVIVMASILFVLVTTYYNIKTNFLSYDSVPIGIETILILVFSFGYLYEQMNDTKNLFIYTQYQFWVIVGFMIYLAGSFFVFIYASQMEHKLLQEYWFLTNVFYVLMNLFFVIAILLSKKNKVSKSILNNPYLN